MICDVICEYIADTSERIVRFNIDGTPKIVDIDETLFFNCKYYLVRIIMGQSYVVGVERGAYTAFFGPVGNKNTDTIIDAILQHFLPKSIIFTDNLRAYVSASRRIYGFEHDIVNYIYNFVNPENPEVIHKTQKI